MMTTFDWLATYDRETGALDKSIARKNDVDLGLLLVAGYIKNHGPDEPSMWDIRITATGIAVLEGRKNYGSPNWEWKQ